MRGLSLFANRFAHKSPAISQNAYETPVLQSGGTLVMLNQTQVKANIVFAG